MLSDKLCLGTNSKVADLTTKGNSSLNPAPCFGHFDEG